jgi:O-antigen/teichoic acid export membrane protein
VKEPASYVTGVGIVYLFEICALSIWSHARHKVASEGNILDAATSVIPVIQQFDTIIIHRFSAEEAGYFSAVSKWPALFANLVSALNFANYKENANNLYTRTEWMRGLFPYFKAYVILSVLVIGFASALIHILIGPNYEPSTQVFQVLMFVSVISFWNQSFYSRLTAQGKNLLLFSIYTPWTTIQLVLIGAMMKDQGLTKAVWVYPVAQLGMLIHFLIAAKE